MGHMPFNLKEFVTSGSLGGASYIVFQLSYTHTALWESFSLCPYKLTPPIFQTGNQSSPAYKVKTCSL